MLVTIKSVAHTGLHWLNTVSHSVTAKIQTTFRTFSLMLIITLGTFFAILLGVWQYNIVDDMTIFRPRTPLGDMNLNKGCGTTDQTPPILLNSINSTSKTERFEENISAETRLFYECSIQTHTNQSVSYDMAFLEFNDQGILREPQQWEALKRHLKEKENITALLFVHGWRNDAHIGSEDVSRFHTMLSLTANYARQRNPQSKTIGIFIGWRGRIIDEKNDRLHTYPLLNALAIPTILSRKPRSDSLAKPIGEKILEIEKLVKGENLDQQHNKLIILGHSLGGNIIIRGLSEKLVERISQHCSNQETRGVGDLIVLLNPASEARNFFDVQKAAFAHPSIEGSSPSVVSLTASHYYDELSNSRTHWDTAVGEYFPIAQRILTLDTGKPQDIQSIGNFLPTIITSSEVVTTRKYGVSHEIEIDESAGVATTYSLAGKASNVGIFPTCPPESSFMEWQKQAIKDLHTSSGVGWDAAFINSEKDFRVSFPRPDQKCSIKVNIRHGAVRNRCRSDSTEQTVCRNAAADSGLVLNPTQHVSIPNIGPAWSLVWNTAAHDDTIKEHDGYLSHTLWCALNRFALDKPEPKNNQGEKK